MYCKKCGNEVEESAKFCDKCGETNKIVTEQRRTNVLALVGFIVACISFFLNLWIVNIVAVILSLVGLIRISKSGEKGRGLAIAGITIGAFSMVLGFCIGIFFTIFSYTLS